MADSFLGAGDLYFDRLTAAGVSQGAKLEGACSAFALNPESEIKEQTGKGRTNYGQVIAAATLPGKTNIKLTLNQLDADNLAVAFLGDVVSGQQASGSIDAGTPLEVVAILDRYVEIGKEGLSNVVVKDATDTTTYVAGTDYILNPRLGMIKALSTGSILAGATLNVSGDYAEVNYQQITGGTSPIIRARLLLDGKNYVNGRNCKVLVKNARLKPSTEVDFLSDDFLPLELEGVCEIPEGDTTAFEIIYYDA
ncbi:hypothetical protein [Syntrophotalea acetylenica]|jgi:hypothetical protein|uniref:phage tail tube protein n=1 Tax=Syntrophotalea acetylenica TaxID=29542 RepID=UPI002A365F74|nr:hypothetical protein [Syntrophotalea acetylenica]MDY0261979.1 hypothetical protein [Syntrophotalea acetylenica]